MKRKRVSEKGGGGVEEENAKIKAFGKYGGKVGRFEC